jgi:hypothetical protein
MLLTLLISEQLSITFVSYVTGAALLETLLNESFTDV